jgi:hypothetical protein
MKKANRLLTVLLLGSCLGPSGCAPVSPWERGNLAKPHMALEPNPALRAHTYMSREAAVSGSVAGGGG